MVEQVRNLTIDRRFGSNRYLLGKLVLALALFGGVMFLTSSAGAHHDGGADPTPDPDSVSFTLEGCRQESLPAGYDIEANGFLCDVGAGVDGYTTGNLGKEWNELDLVPWRVTADAGNSAPASQTYTIAFVVDHEEVGVPGYDVITAPTLNAALSDGSCVLSFGGEADLTPGFGGTDTSLYRFLTITQAQNSECVIDGQARLAVGSHDFPGSSLHMNLGNHVLTTAGIGNKDVSIPVMEIEPQEIDKDMTATQDTDHVWNLTKQPTPASLDFGNVCSANFDNTLNVGIQVSWQILPGAPGEVKVVTNIYATNPAARSITVNVTDQVYGDIGAGEVLLDTASSGDVVIPANTNQLVFTHMFDAPANVTGLNDVATATYIDTVTGVPVPGQTTAAASANIQPGAVTNSTAVIDDTESITGTGLTFQVDSTTGASGAFQNGYVLGTPTTGPVDWQSATQNGNGSVTFNKTVILDQRRITSGSLTDTATLNASSGFVTTANASVNITSSATVQLTINKTIPNVLQGAETDSFEFIVTGPGGFNDTVTIDFAAGETAKSAMLTGLAPGTYTVDEVEQAGWIDPPNQQTAINLPNCSGSVSFANTFIGASARVQKVTLPAGSEAGWTMTLNGPGGPEQLVTTAAGFQFFNLVLQEGNYTITETAQAGWDQINAVGCSFTVEYPRDFNKVFDCTITNEADANIIVKKKTDPAGSAQLFEFNPSWTNNFFLSDGGSHDSGDLDPGSYSVSEIVPPGWDLINTSCVSSNGGIEVNNNIGLSAGETVTCTFTNEQDANIVVKKETLPDGSAQEFEFKLVTQMTPFQTFSLTDGQSHDSGDLDPGTYGAFETEPAGWDLTGTVCVSSNGDNENANGGISLQAGETVTCTFTNRQRGMVNLLKLTDGVENVAMTWNFTLTGPEVDESDSSPPTTVDFGGAKLIPGEEYTLCEVGIPPGWTQEWLVDTDGDGVPETIIPMIAGVNNDPVDPATGFSRVYDPNYVPSPGQFTNDTKCVNFVVDPGETLAFQLDNSFPGGEPRTIGFWKNWNTCSRGNQAATAAANGGAAAGWYILDDLLNDPGFTITIGALELDGGDCADARSLLDKRDIDSGKKRASDGAYNLASQLLAAQLNLSAGAETCLIAFNAVTAGQNLLVDIGFDGTGSYLKGKQERVRRADANQLAGILDAYNNGVLCSP